MQRQNPYPSARPYSGSDAGLCRSSPRAIWNLDKLLETLQLRWGKQNSAYESENLKYAKTVRKVGFCLHFFVRYDIMQGGIVTSHKEGRL